MLSYFWPDLSRRSSAVELMDLRSSDQNKLFITLDQFKIINILFTRARYLIRKHIISDMVKDRARAYSFLDIGAGGCDIAQWLLKKCHKKGINVHITCIDNDDRIIRYSEEKCREYENIEIRNMDAFAISDLDSFDYMFGNHFLHHLPDDKLCELIKMLIKKTKRKLLLIDLIRSNLAYLGYTLFAGIFFHNSFAYYDGRISIQKGFRVEELQKYLAGDHAITIDQIHPARIYILKNNEDLNR